MTDSRVTVPSAVLAFRALHESGCFVMPNPWDAGSAVFLGRLGFRALATTSAGAAFARGLPDAVSAFSTDAMLAHISEIVLATPLPVNADFQAGYAHDSAGVATNVKRCVHTGAAGLSIEDATGDDAAPLYDHALAVERVRAARAAIDETGIPVVLTARCEAWLLGVPAAERLALDRLVAYAGAGADCVFAPGVRDPAALAAIVKAVAPHPVNVLVSAPTPGLTVARLADLGVRRISVGSALARVAWAASSSQSGPCGVLQNVGGCVQTPTFCFICFDVHYLSSRFEFDRATVTEAVRRTFERRRTPFPAEDPIGLTPLYWENPSRPSQVQAFVRRAGLAVPANPGAEFTRLLYAFLAPVLEDLRTGTRRVGRWPPGRP